MISFNFKLTDIEGLCRLDSEYYNPVYLNKIRLIRNLNSKKLSDLFNIELGSPYSSKKITKTGEIPLSKIGDVTNKRDFSNWDFLSSNEFVKFGNRNIKQNDILMTLTGDPPDVGKIHMPFTSFDDQNLVITFNQRVAKLESKNIDPFYLFAALSTEYFRVRFEQCAFGIRQRNVSIPDLKTAYVFIPVENEINAISKLVREHFRLKILSQTLYKQATDLLEQELGLDKITFEKKKSYVASFSEVVNNNRSDAEFFDIKFKPLLDIVNLYKNGVKTIRETSNRINTNYNFKSSNTEEIIYVEIGDINVGDGSFDFKTIKAKDAPANAKIKLSGGEILISMVRPTRGAISIVPEIEDDSTVVCSGAFYVINTIELEKREIVWLYLRLVKSLFEKYCGGSSYPTLDSKYLDTFPIPNFNDDISKKISDLISVSMKSKRESKRLLEEAKTRVEQLIEEAANS